MKLSIKTRHKPQEYILEVHDERELVAVRHIYETDGGFWVGRMFIPWHEIVWIEVVG